jgi:hypothetical protein
MKSGPPRQLSGESLARTDEVKPGSERQFGLVMATFFALLTLSALWRHAVLWSLLLGAVAIGFAVAALLRPLVLSPLNRLWFRFGLLLHAIVNPVIMGLMYFAVITPIALLMRVLGKRPIPLEPDRAATSYWRRRDTAPGPMSKQF